MILLLRKFRINVWPKNAYLLISPILRVMSVFTKKLNPLTGDVQWVLQDEDYDFHQEIARSAFADMLHDTDRNEKYYAAIKMVIEKTHRSGKKAHVLDIGTGTGLLAMMAAKCGADTIYACEAFSPISECAEQIIKDNGLSDRITVIHKRSTKMTAGEGGDMPRRANILVTEVFDTECIGEGAISTFNHAHQHLLEKDCLVVPTSGTVYAQVVESEWLQRCNSLNPWSAIIPSAALLKCPGTPSVYDLQINQISRSDFNAITSPQPVFRFDWSRGGIPEEDLTETPAEVLSSGSANVVFMWWTLNMDPQGSVVLSCAPKWAHPESTKELPWRDHWMQAVYFLPSSVPVTKGQKVTLLSNHDEYSLWFNLTTENRPNTKTNKRPYCDCMLHSICSRTRLGMLNDPSRRAKYLKVLQHLVTPETVALSFGDTSLLGLMAAKLGAKKVYHVEGSSLSKKIWEDLVKENNLEDKVTIFNSGSAKLNEEVRSSINLVLGEPYFLNTLYPWDILRWWFLRQQCPSAPCMPVAAVLYMMPMQFDHLHKIRAPLGTISGFTMTSFDKLIEKSSTLSDSPVEIQPLWEYPGSCLSHPKELLRFELESSLPQSDLLASGKMPFTVGGTCHGVALWLDIHLDHQGTVVSTGPQECTIPGQRVCWDPYTRQGVYFTLPQQTVTPQTLLGYRAAFSPTTSEITFKFDFYK